MGTSIRFLIIVSFLFVIILCSSAFYFLSRTSAQIAENGNYHLNLKSARVLLLQLNQVVEEINDGQKLDSNFYTSNLSKPEIQYNRLKGEAFQMLKDLNRSPVTKREKLQIKLSDLSKLFKQNIQIYDRIISLNKRKGFKDFGLEGTMRRYAHQLYDGGDEQVKFLCLHLRKHEKDFILRKDLYYLGKFEQVQNELVQYLKTNAPKNRSETFANLFYYGRYFHLLVRVETRIGLRNSSGELQKSALVEQKIDRQITRIDERLALESQVSQKQLQTNTRWLIILLIVFLTMAVTYLSWVITKSIRSTAISFDRYINSGFNFESVSANRSRIKEFNIINVSFLKMAKEINIFTNFFREKVLERTLEITNQKEEIERQRNKIKKQYASLVSKNDQLHLKKALLLRRNSDIKDSLHYAKRIQKAIRPPYLKNQRFFSEMFVYSKAKDVVSGDFFLTYDVTIDPHEPLILILAGDCTGHGVPGALMSVLGINILRKIVKERKLIEPGEILTNLNRDLTQMLAGESEIMADGMDMSVVLYNKTKSTLRYCNAKFSSLLLSEGIAVPIQKERHSIGYSFIQKVEEPFATHEIQVKKGDCLYLFSDGMQDQFGGKNNKKFKRKTIVDILVSNHSREMNEQREKLRTRFLEWKGNFEQTDDVLFAGIRF